MAHSIGTIKEISGIVIARNAMGEERVLKVGDTINYQDTISTIGAGSHATLTLADGREIALGGNDGLLLDKSVYAAGEAFGDEAVISQKTASAVGAGKSAAEIQEALLRGEDITNLEETAAGGEGAPGGANLISGFATAQYVAGGTESNVTGSERDLGDGAGGATLFASGLFDVDPNDAPVIGSLEGAMIEELNGENTFTGNLATGTDADGDALTYALVADSISVNTELVSIPTVTVNADGTYTVTGDFNALAAGESATITFQYVADDGQGFDGTDGTNASSISAPATVTIVITGTNDQPVVSDITVGSDESVTSWLLGTSVNSNDDESEMSSTDGVDLDAINAFISPEGLVEIGNLFTEGDGTNPTDGSAIKFTVNTIAGETVTFNWTFNDEEGDEAPYNDFSFVVIDGQTISLLASVSDEGDTNSGVFTYTFTTAGAHEITFGVMNDDDTSVDSNLEITYVSGGEITNVETIGYVEPLATNAVYESTDAVSSVEDVTTLFEGTLPEVQDDDVSDTHTYTIVEETVTINNELISMPTVTVNPDGTYSVSGNFNALAAGETATITFQYVAIDSSINQTNGESNTSAPATVTLTITGTNDQPVVEDVTVSQAESLDTINTFEGSLSASDDDTSDTHTFHVAMNEDESYLHIDSPVSIEITNFEFNEDGTYSLSGDFNALAVGETATITFQYYVVDDSSTQANGESNTSEVKTVTLTITGTNDTPVISADSQVTGTATEAGNLDDGTVVAATTATGTMVATDVDHNAMLTWSVDGDGVGTYGNFSVDADGNWVYTVDSTVDSAADSLAEGESVEETFTVIVTDEYGATATQVVTVIVVGTNDSPVISDSSTTLGTAYEAGNKDNGDVIDAIVATGTLSATDVDNGATLIWSIDGNSTGTYGTFVIDPASGEWTYTVDSTTGSSADQLAEGESVEETFTVTVTDENGATDTQVVTITVVGTNDSPVAVADTDSIKEAGSGNIPQDVDFGDIFTTGNLLSNDSDVDGDTNPEIALDVIKIVSDSTGASDTTATWGQLNVNGAYGVLFVDKESGDYTYILNNSNSTVNALNEGDSVVETFTYTITDANGADVTSTLSLTIEGTNDAPVISGTITGTAREAGNYDDNSVRDATVATGTLIGSDVDNTDLTWSISGSATKTYGTFAIDPVSGVWSYTVDATAGSAADKLAEGQVRYETYTVVLSDNESTNPKTDTQTITIKIVGTNDSPVIAETNITGTATEAGNADDGSVIAAIKATGTLVAYDVDNGATQTWSVSGSNVGTYGSFTINAHTGKWVYTVDATTGSAADQLAEGESKTETFTVLVTDDKGATDTQVVTVTVVGTNDSPIAIAQEADAVEDTIITGTIEASDVDNGSSLTFTTTATVEGLTLNSDGTYEFDATSYDYLAVGEIETIEVPIVVTDDMGAETQTTLTINVTGTNDQPVVSAIDANGTLVSGNIIASNETDTYIADVSTTESTITFTNVGTIEDLNVQINLTHTWDADLDVYLIAPDGTVIELTSDNGENGDNYTNTTFDDEATTSITNGSAPFTGVFKPEGDLSALEGMDLSGTWTLHIVDDAGLDVGTLLSWSIEATVSGGTVVYESSDAVTSVEDVTTTFAGNLATASDDDVSDSHTYSLVDNSVTTNNALITTLPTVTINADGTYNVSGNFNALAAGETVTITFQYVADDGHGFDGSDGVNESSISEPATVTLTITGTNDQPVVSDVSVETQEASTGTNTFEGTLLASDVDENDEHTFYAVEDSLSVESDVAIDPFSLTLVVNEDGSYSLSGDFNALAVGESATITFQYYAVDTSTTQANGESNTSEPATITLIVTGTNDAPIFTVDGTAYSFSYDENSTAGTLIGTVAATDVDGDAITYSITSGNDAGYFAIDATTGEITLTEAGATAFTNNYEAMNNVHNLVVGANDGTTTTSIGVTLSENDVNDAPDAVDNTYVISGLSGQYYAYHEGTDGTNLTNLAKVDAFIATHAADATFAATSIDYTYIASGNLGGNGKLQTFLGSDASTLSTDPENSSDAIIKLSGSVELDAGTYTFRVTSDDGFSIVVDGVVVASNDSIHSPTTTNYTVTIPEGGAHSISIVYWDQGGEAVLKVELKNNATDTEFHVLTGSSDTLSNLVTNEDTPLIIDPSILLANDTDEDGDTLSILSVQDATHGTVAIVNGQVVFTPEANYNGDATFTYTISDGNGGTDTATVTLHVNPINDAPVATPSISSGDEDTSIAVNLGGADVDGTIASITITSLPTAAQGVLYYADGTTPVATDTALTPTEAANLVFTPTADFNGTVTVSFTVTDNDGATSSSADEVITVNPVNDAPDAIDDTYSYLGENLIINGSFEDINGVDSNGAVVTGVALGSLGGTSLVHMESITGWNLVDPDMPAMEPHAGGHANVGTTDGNHYMDLGATPGNSAISQEISGLTEGATYQFSVDYRDKALMQGEGEASGVMQILWNGVVVATVDGNNTDAWETLTLTLVAQDGTNTLTFNEIGTSDDNAGIAIDNVQLKSINAELVTDEDTALTIAPSVLLGNDTDVDGDTLSITSVQGATHGIVALVNGHVVFTPEANYNGEATFTYTISDGNGGADTATVTLYVTPVNDAPVAVDDAFETEQDTALTNMNVLGNDTDEENDTLSVTDANSNDGSVTINSDGTLNFTPNANFTGVATITYAISDSNGGTDTATVLVTVNAPVEHAPTLSVDTGNTDNTNDTVLEAGLTTGSNPSASDTTAEGTFTVGDPDGLADISSVTVGGTTFTIGTGVGEFHDLASLIGETVTTTSGEVEITSYNNGVFGYAYTLTTATNGTTATDSFNVSVSDGNETASATVTIGISDDAPIAYNDAVSLVEGTTSGTSTTNLMLVLDFSASMAGSNLTAMKNAVSALIEAYDNVGDFSLKIVTFGTDSGTSAVAGVFTTLQSVVDWLATVDSNDLTYGTNYDTAISTAMSAWTAADIDGADSSNSIVYFISDGEPSNTHGLSTSETNTWEDYVDDNFAKAIAIGIGNGATAADTDLKAVAYTPGGTDEVYLVTNLSELTDTLVGTVETPTTSDGSVVTQTGALNLADVSGADGWDDPKLVSVAYEGTTYTFDTTHTSFTIVTDAGTVTIDNQGNYSFTSLIDVKDNVSDSISYTVADNDGSTAQAQLTLTTLDSSETVAVSDTVTIVSNTTTTTTATTGAGAWTDSGNNVTLSNNNATVALSTSNFGSAQATTTTTQSQSFTVAQEGTVSVKVTTSDVSNGDSFKITLSDGTTATLTRSGSSWSLSGSSNASWSISGSNITVTFTNVSQGEKTMTVTATKLDATFSNLSYPSSTTTTTTTTNVWDSVGTTAAAVLTGIISGNILTNDLLGSEGSTITQIDGASVSGTSVTITGEYGTLVINTETGAYTYTLNTTGSVGSTGDVDTFTYTLAQADGDTSSANLTFNFASSVGTTGTDGADTLVASSDAGVTLYGGEGDDHLIGGAGNDTLYGGAGSDTLEGDAGDDYLDGGAGSDALYGGAGNDTLVYDASDSIIDGGADTDTLLINTDGSVDLSNVAAIATSIEVVDLTQASVALTINPADVLSITDDASTILKITGDSNDSVSGTGWTASTDTADLDAGYTRYESSADSSIKIDIQNTIVTTDFN